MSLSSKLNLGGVWEQPALTPFNALTSAVGRVLQRWPDIAPDPPEKDREELVQLMLARLETDNWEGAHVSFAISAARAAFDEKRRQRADLHALRNFYAEEIKASTSTTFLTGMASVYWGSFAPGAAHTVSLAQALREKQAQIGSSWADLLRRFPFLLDPHYGPDNLAKLMINMADPWRELIQLGIRLPHAPGFMDHAHIAYVKLLQPNVHERASLDRLTGWLKPEGQLARSGGAAEAIAAILGHWKTRNPAPELVSHITHFLVSAYQDPRINAGGVWSGVPPDTLAVIMRWLTGENIRFFLDTVTEAEDSHMWEPRRKFWLKLYEQSRISAAWVAFSDEAERIARRSKAGKGPGSILTYGHQIAGGGRKNTSLLILEIGNKIVVEGSHNYKVHVFRKNSPKTPQLYLRSYDCESIRLIRDEPRGFHEACVHDAYGNWRNWVMERI